LWRRRPARQDDRVTQSTRWSIAPRRLAVALAIGLAAGGGALGLGTILDDPANRSAEDVAQPIIVGAVAGQPIAPATGTATDPGASLPPIAPVLDRPAPNGISGLEPSVQVARLREIIAQADASPRRWVELGSAYQALGDASAAEKAYREAARRDPRDLAPRVGLAMVTGSRGPAGLRAAAATLGRLAERHPDNQLVVFNQGWLALYQRDVPTVLRTWRRAVTLAPKTLLGRTAAGLLRQINANGAGAGPASP
jgi:cytochrome c-type biogenesis protein CcmH/NrfG